MDKVTVAIAILIIILSIIAIALITDIIGDDCPSYNLAPGGMDIIYSGRVGLLVNGSISYSEFLSSLYKSNTTQPIWARIHVLGVYDPSGEVFIIDGRKCIFKSDSEKAVFRAVVEEVIDGNTSLEGKEIIVYVNFEMIKGDTIVFPDFLRPVLPCRTYIALLRPTKIWISGNFRCGGRYSIASLSTNVYMIEAFTVFLYKDGMVYHLVFARNLGDVDNVYAGLKGEEYRGDDHILSTPLPYDEFVEELKTVIAEAKEFSRQP